MCVCVCVCGVRGLGPQNWLFLRDRTLSCSTVVQAWHRGSIEYLACTRRLSNCGDCRVQKYSLPFFIPPLKILAHFLRRYIYITKRNMIPTKQSNLIWTECVSRLGNPVSCPMAVHQKWYNNTKMIHLVAIRTFALFRPKTAWQPSAVFVIFEGPVGSICLQISFAKAKSIF